MAVTSLDSYTKFKNYCLRALGQDGTKMIKVNITEDQLQDRISDAVKKWQDFHFEGSTVVSLYKSIRAEDQRRGYLEVPELNAITEILTAGDSDRSSVEAFDNIEYQFFLDYYQKNLRHGGFGGSIDTGLTDYWINMSYLSSLRWLLREDRLFTFNATTNQLILQDRYPLNVGPTLVEQFRLNNWVVGTGTDLNIDVEEMPNGKMEGSQLINTDGGVNPIHAEFTYETNYYPRGLRTFSVMLKQGDYTGQVRLRVLDRDNNVVVSKTIQPLTFWKTFEVEAFYKEPHVNDFVFEIESVDPANNEHFFAYNPFGYRNNFLILLGYKTTVPDDVDLSWDSGWLKAYAIALIKKQWAQNLKKYEGIQMAGGVTLNAQALFDEATAELEGLNEELSSTWSMPPAMFVG